jgi:hypothetical protein
MVGPGSLLTWSQTSCSFLSASFACHMAFQSARILCFSVSCCHVDWSCLNLSSRSLAQEPLCSFIAIFLTLLRPPILLIPALNPDARVSVRLKAPHWSGYSSVVRRDRKQLIGRKPAPTTAVKTGLGETPPERGIPRRIELRQIKIKYKTLCRSLQNPDSMTYNILRVP